MSFLLKPLQRRQRWLLPLGQTAKRLGQKHYEPAWPNGWMGPDFATSMNSYTQGPAVLHSVSFRKTLRLFFSIIVASRAK